ncbi:ribonuclease E inhibitor RraB [Shewanella yunxiaonensis]|uniref:Ribonuclease E inhibitor RraB n=1 Tax=Shewanella yunxiaonensis TaxID=2829809 RepID=A0ABX7YPX7_9GAMM|nr:MULTISPECIES: ribonuclease E inhibitor RraB [Shewanella]MDF0533585.1 ribonuclease E inhibitor RraB [Shewanella sp. A32]QUN04664.1 ribonuclease E inhibitor RraB [Shewanella yunxiaonensis]
MQFPDDDNGQMLQAMSDSGMDLSQSMAIDFFLVFEEQRDAESALEDLIAAGHSDDVELSFNDEIEKWEVIVSVEMVPDYDAIVAKETELNDFAAEFDGMTDGWGVMQHQDGDEFADDDDDHECDEHCHH